MSKRIPKQAILNACIEKQEALIQNFESRYLEMKAEDGGIQPEQLDYRDLLRAQGYRAEVCYGFEEARGVIEGYLANA